MPRAWPEMVGLISNPGGSNTSGANTRRAPLRPTSPWSQRPTWCWQILSAGSPGARSRRRLCPRAVCRPANGMRTPPGH